MSTAPAPEDLAATTTSYLEIDLTATDSQGVSTTVRQDLPPNLVEVTLATGPPGLHVDVNGTTFVAPHTLTSWEVYDLNAPDQIDASGNAWTFDTWSDGGAVTHVVVTPASAATYMATFTEVPASTANSFIPIAGSYTSEETQPTAHGGYPYLRLQGSTPHRNSYLRFALAGSAARSSARPCAYTRRATRARALDVHALPDDSWQESTLTWTNRRRLRPPSAPLRGRWRPTAGSQSTSHRSSVATAISTSS
jgi:hypothetical protein